jgi:hypothetical protein
MVAWRVAKCLLVARDQMQARHPGTPNPGFIGDDAHASRTSDHNPWVDDPASSVNVVTAGDFYHRPQLGFDAGKFAEQLKASGDPRIKYVIWNRRIWSRARASEGWRPYNGTNPHTGHCHLSVSSSKSLYDSTRSWNLPVLTKPAAPTDTTPKELFTVSQFTELLAAIRDEAAATRKEIRRQRIGDDTYDLQTVDEVISAEKAFDVAYDASKAAGKSDTVAMAEGRTAAQKQVQFLIEERKVAAGKNEAAR